MRHTFHMKSSVYSRESGPPMDNPKWLRSRRRRCRRGCGKGVHLVGGDLDEALQAYRRLTDVLAHLRLTAIFKSSCPPAECVKTRVSALVSRASASFNLVAASRDVDGRDVSAFTRVFNALCPGRPGHDDPRTEVGRYSRIV